MFESFNKKYESVVRTIVTIWISVWTFFNFFSFLISLASYSSIVGKSSEIGFWFFNSIASFVGFVLAAVILFLLNATGKAISLNKKIKFAGLLLTMGCIYFILPTFTSLFGNALFKPNDFITYLPFTFIWLLPSLTFTVFFVIYFLNLNKYNEKFIEKNKQESNV